MLNERRECDWLSCCVCPVPASQSVHFYRPKYSISLLRKTHPKSDPRNLKSTSSIASAASWSQGQRTRPNLGVYLNNTARAVHTSRSLVVFQKDWGGGLGHFHWRYQYDQWCFSSCTEPSDTFVSSWDIRGKLKISSLITAYKNVKEQIFPIEG